MFAIRAVVLVCVIFSSYGSVFKEFHTGWVRDNYLLVSKDTFYRQRVPFKIVYGYYYKKVKCPITFIKVTDRLGVQPGPTAEIIKGGLRHNYVVLLIGSVYNRPAFVDVYISCENMNKYVGNSSAENYDK